MLSYMSSMAIPTKMYSIGHLNCVAFRHLRIKALRLDMSTSSVGMVACVGHPPELITVGVNRPGLGEQFPIFMLHFAP